MSAHTVPIDEPMNTSMTFYVDFYQGEFSTGISGT
jgi:hypothetical protein